MKTCITVPNDVSVLRSFIDGSLVIKDRDKVEHSILIGEIIPTNEAFRIHIDELKLNIAVVGYIYDAINTNFKIVEEAWEIGHSYLILDLHGYYTKLMNVIPSVKIFRAGIDFAIPLFDPYPLDPEVYFNALVKLMAVYLDLGNIEQRLLYSGLMELHEKVGSKAGIVDFLVTIQDIEESPTLTIQEYSKIDSLIRALAPMLRGRTAAAFSHKMPCDFSSLFNGLTVIDMSRMASNYRPLMAALLLLKGLCLGRSCMVLIDEASSIFPHNEGNALHDLFSAIDKGRQNGVFLHISSSTIHALSPNIISRIGTFIVHRTIDYYDLRLIEQVSHNIETDISANEALFFSISGRIATVRIHKSLAQDYTVPSDEEIEAHMKALGIKLARLEEVKQVKITLLERDFRDSANCVYMLLKASTEQVLTRGEAITLLTDKGLPSDVASRLLDAIQALGYLREDYVSGRRVLLLTRKGSLAISEYEDKVKSAEAEKLLKNIRGGINE
ncbi:MAG: hypothetical protein J7J99_07405 [Thermoprotei archaeon]|nr:hypothetical protein [Thermoprotei archaeon]